MTAAILTRFDELNVWKQGDQRAPHKPLLILFALGRWQQGITEVTYRETEPEMKALLQEFGPHRKSDHPEQNVGCVKRNRADAPIICKDYGRLTQSVDVHGKTSSTLYDSNGQVTQSVDAAGFVWTTFYDDIGQVTQRIDGDGDGATTQQFYDALGNVTVTVDGNGKSAFQYYDDARQLTATTA